MSTYVELTAWGRHSGTTEGGKLYINTRNIQLIVEKFVVYIKDSSGATVPDVVVGVTFGGKTWPVKGRYADIVALVEAATP